MPLYDARVGVIFIEPLIVIDKVQEIMRKYDDKGTFVIGP